MDEIKKELDDYELNKTFNYSFQLEDDYYLDYDVELDLWYIYDYANDEVVDLIKTEDEYYFINNKVYCNLEHHIELTEEDFKEYVEFVKEQE